MQAAMDMTPSWPRWCRARRGSLMGLLWPWCRPSADCRAPGALVVKDGGGELLPPPDLLHPGEFETRRDGGDGVG